VANAELLVPPSTSQAEPEDVTRRTKILHHRRYLSCLVAVGFAGHEFGHLVDEALAVTLTGGSTRWWCRC
jgi:hypothetical protein